MQRLVISFVFLSLSLALSVPTSAAPLAERLTAPFRAPHSAVACWALMEARPSELGAPLASLRDVQHHMKQKLGSRRNDLELEPNYHELMVEVPHLNKKAGLGFQKEQLLEALGRLNQLETDVTAGGSLTIGFEIRGENQILQTLSTIRQRTDSLDGEIQASLREQYPLIRRQTLIDFVAKAGPASLIGAGLMAGSAPVSGTGAALYLLARKYKNKKVSPPWKASARRTLDYYSLIEGHLERHREAPEDNPVALMMSQTDIFSKEYSDEIMSCRQAHPSESLYQECERSIADLADLHKEWKSQQGRDLSEISFWRFVEEKTAIDFEIVMWDHVFYVDPQSLEPVWVVYARSFDDLPQRPRRRRRRQMEFQGSQPEWGPQLEPIPIPTGKK